MIEGEDGEEQHQEQQFLTFHGYLIFNNYRCTLKSSFCRVQSEAKKKDITKREEEKLEEMMPF